MRRSLALRSAVLLGRLAAFTVVVIAAFNLLAGTIRDDVSDDEYATLAAMPEYAPVGEFLYDQGASPCQASGTLIASRWVLTAAQVTSGSSGMTFTIDGVTYGVGDLITHPNWDGSTGSNGYDIGLVRLADPITSVGPAIRYAGMADVGATATIVGYGMTGTGLTGATLPGGVKRAGQNVLDNTGGAGNSSNYLMADFDNPGSAADSTWGSPTPLALEYSSAPGDTGGGVFIDVAGAARVAGVVSFGQAGPYPAHDGDPNADYGDLMGFTRVSAFNNWIDDTIAARWNNAAGGSVHSAANYQGGWAPDHTDILSFSDISDVYTVSFSGTNTYSKVLARQGTVTFDLGGATQTVDSPMFNGSLVVARDSGDTASLTLTNGTLSAVDGFIAASSGSSGTLTVSGSGSKLMFSDSLYVGGSQTNAGGSGVFSVAPGASVAVAGKLKLWSTNATVDNNGSLTVQQLDFAGGRVTGSGDLIVTGASTWTVGTMDGSGTTTIHAGGTLSISPTEYAKIKLHRKLVNEGTLVWTSTTSLDGGTSGATGSIENKAGATFDAQGDGIFAYQDYARPTLNNAGLFKRKGTGQLSVTWTFNNTGLVDVQSGKLYLIGGGTCPGEFNVVFGGQLSVAAPFNFAGSTFTNAGVVSFSADSGDLTGATFVNTGTLSISASSIDLRGTTLTNAGTVNFFGASAFNVNGTTFVNSGTITFSSSTCDLTGAMFSGTGFYRITSFGTTTNGGHYDGNVVLDSGALNIKGPTTFTNLVINGGTLTGSGDVTVTGGWTRGRMEGTGKTIVPTGGTLTIGPSGSYLFLLRAFENRGTVICTSTGTRNTFDGADSIAVGRIDNQAGATFQMQASSRLAYAYSTPPTFNNAGLFQQTAGTTDVEWTFNNTGNVDLHDGTLNLSGGGTSPGTFSVASGATLAFWNHTLRNATIVNAGTVSFASGSVDLANVTINGTGVTHVASATVYTNGGSYNGPFRLSAGTLHISGATTMPNLTQDGGILKGNADLTLTGSSLWTAGTMEGAGKTVVLAGAALTLNASLSGKLYLYRKLENRGAIAWTNPCWIYGGKSGAAGIIDNKAGATFDTRDNGSLLYEAGVRGTFNNGGLFKKSAGGGTTGINWTFNNTGTVDVQSGTLSLSGGGTSPGDFNVASGAKLSVSAHNLSSATFTNAGTLEFPTGSVSLTGATFSNSGTVAFPLGLIDLSGVGFTGSGLNHITGATVTTSGGSYGGNFRLSNGTLSIDGPTTFVSLANNGGILTGSGDLTITETGTCTAGTLEGPGKTVIAAGATLALSNTTASVYWYRPLENSGTVVWSGTNSVQGDKPGATGSIENVSGATFDAQADGTLDYSNNTRGIFNNAGLFKKSSGTGTTSVLWTFNNTGTVDVQSGTLLLSSVGTTTGIYNIASGATLSLGGTASLSPTTVNNNGRVRIISGTPTLATGTYTGAYELAGGTLGSTGDLIFAQPFTWSGGTIDAGVNVIALEGGALHHTGGSLYLYGILENNGAMNWTGAGNYYGDKSGAAGTLQNQPGATFDAQGDATFKSSYSPRATFSNAGLFRKSAGGGSTRVEWTLNNTGTVDVLCGTLTLSGGGTSPGAFNVAGGATLAIASHNLTTSTVTNAGTVIFSSGVVDLTDADLSGAGLYDIGGATVTMLGDEYSGRFRLSLGTLILGGPTDLEDFAQNGGTLAGNGNLTVTGVSTWAGGTIEGAGKTIVPTGATLAIAHGSSTVYLYRTLENSGTVTWTGTGQLRGDRFGASGSIDNKIGATFDAQADGAMYYSGYIRGTVKNAGLFQKSNGTGTTDVQWMFQNTGTVEVQKGTLRLSGGGTSHGTFNVANGATLVMAPHNLTNATFTNAGTVTFGAGAVDLTGACLSGAGLYDVAGATVTMNGSSSDHLRLSAGTLTVAGPTAAANFTQNGGTILGSGDITLTGLSIWAGGTMSGTGKTIVPPATTLAISGTSTKSLARGLDNAGTIAWSDTGAVQTTGAPTLNNTGQIVLASDAALTPASGSPSTLNNSGTLRKTAGVGISVLNANVNNIGVIAVESGTLELGGVSGSNSGEMTGAANTVLSFRGNAFRQTGGTLNTAGAVELGRPVVTYVFAATPFENLNLLPGYPGVTTLISAGDDVAVPVDLGNDTFNLYGIRHTGVNSLFVSSNALITGGTSYPSATNTNLSTSPSMRAIAPLWDGWKNSSVPSVLTKVEDTNGDGTNDRMIIEWNENKPDYYSTTDYVTHQVILELNTGNRPGNITFNYVDLATTSSVSDGKSATIGVKADGTNNPPRTVISYNAAHSLVGSGKAIRLAPVVSGGSDTYFLEDGSFIAASLWNAGVFDQTGGLATIGAVEGPGAIRVGGGTETAMLVAECIRQNTLTIKANGVVQIASGSGDSGTSIVDFLDIANGSGSLARSLGDSSIEPFGANVPINQDATAPVPEPAAWLLLLAAGIVLLVSRHRGG